MKTLDFLKSGARLIGTLFAVIVLIPLCIALVVSVGGVLLARRDSNPDKESQNEIGAVSACLARLQSVAF